MANVGRPRRPYNGVEEITPKRARWASDVSRVPLKVRQRQRWDTSRFWTYRYPNGLGDPLTYMFVLDAIVNNNPDIELRTGNLVRWLNANQKQFMWDPITVGKVLADICEHWEQYLDAKNGILVQGHDYRGTFYRIAHNPDTINLYYRVREDLMKMGEETRKAQELGHPFTRNWSPLVDCPSLKPEFSDLAV